MPSNSHQSILVEAINEYFDRDYKLISLNSNLTDNYRPDAVMENEDEMVIIEAIITSDRTQKVDDIQKFFTKKLRIDKRMKKPKRSKTSGGIEVTKERVFKVFEAAYPEDLSIVDASLKAGVSDPTGATYIWILEAEGKIELHRLVGRAKMFKLVKEKKEDEGR